MEKTELAAIGDEITPDFLRSTGARLVLSDEGAEFYATWVDMPELFVKREWLDGIDGESGGLFHWYFNNHKLKNQPQTSVGARKLMHAFYGE